MMLFITYELSYIDTMIISPKDRFTDRHSLLHTAGTIREQLGTDMLAQYGDFGT